MDAYLPLANFWVTHGFLVLQPTFLDSKTLSDDPLLGRILVSGSGEYVLNVMAAFFKNACFVLVENGS